MTKAYKACIKQEASTYMDSDLDWQRSAWMNVKVKVQAIQHWLATIVLILGNYYLLLYTALTIIQVTYYSENQATNQSNTSPKTRGGNHGNALPDWKPGHQNGQTKWPLP
jgi:hypothetical protein